MQYTSLCFNALTKDNQPIYHTNVITCIGNNFIVFCLEEVIKNWDEKAAIVQYIGQTNRRLIEISEEQMFKFAGKYAPTTQQICRKCAGLFKVGLAKIKCQPTTTT